MGFSLCCIPLYVLFLLVFSWQDQFECLDVIVPTEEMYRLAVA